MLQLQQRTFEAWKQWYFSYGFQDFRQLKHDAAMLLYVNCVTNAKDKTALLCQSSILHKFVYPSLSSSFFIDKTGKNST